MIHEQNGGNGSRSLIGRVVEVDFDDDSVFDVRGQFLGDLFLLLSIEQDSHVSAGRKQFQSLAVRWDGDDAILGKLHLVGV
jgi:hypothetical protein